MPILNYTTKIDPWKTVNEVEQIMSKHNVSHFSIKNEGSWPVALSFTINHLNQPLNFLLPCNHEGVLECMKRDRKIPKSSKTREQALRTSWRIIKDWVEAQLAIVDAEIMPIQEVFMSRLIINSSGETLSDHILHGNGMKLLN
jgi:hypothetical protein